MGAAQGLEQTSTELLQLPLCLMGAHMGSGQVPHSVERMRDPKPRDGKEAAQLPRGNSVWDSKPGPPHVFTCPGIFTPPWPGQDWSFNLEPSGHASGAPVATTVQRRG